MKYFPQTIGIELVRGCNFSCPMCPVTAWAPRESQKWQFMDLSLLEQIRGEIDRHSTIRTIWMFGGGEPLAHPQYRACLEIMDGVSARVIQHTNASLLSGDRADAILQTSTIDDLVFSFDGFGDRESFELLRGPHFDRVMDNIRRFAERRAERPGLRLSTCSILPRSGEVDGLTVPDRQSATEQLRGLFEPLGIEVQVRDMHGYSRNADLPVTGHSMPVAAGCIHLERDSIYLAHDGTAQPCCVEYDLNFNIGRFPDSSFSQLLNSKRVNSLRHKLRLDQRQGVSHCESCDHSVAGHTSPQRFWRKRQKQHPVTDKAELAHLGKYL